MEILAQVGESDIAQIKVGQPVEFTVQALPGQTFKATVKQVRLQSTTQDNVVNYTVVVAVDNTSGKLLPGMTARANFLTNQPSALQAALAPGIYGLSNGALDEPWPKTMQIKSRLLEWIMNDETQPQILLDALRDDTAPQVGLSTAAVSDVEIEPRNTPVFIRHPVYGTRCSTVVAIDNDGEGLIVERRYSAAAEEIGETALRFRWPLVPDQPRK